MNSPMSLSHLTSTSLTCILVENLVVHAPIFESAGSEFIGRGIALVVNLAHSI